jgi:hypothetical protein
MSCLLSSCVYLYNYTLLVDAIGPNGTIIVTGVVEFVNWQLESKLPQNRAPIDHSYRDVPCPVKAHLISSHQAWFPRS